MPFELTKDQARTIRKLGKFLNAKECPAEPLERVFVLVGAAGTGKSHCVSLIGDILPKATKVKASTEGAGQDLDDLVAPTRMLKWQAAKSFAAPTPDDEGIDSTVTFTAPTNQAAKVLTKFLAKIDPRHGLPSKAKTIYSALRIQMVDEEGQSSLKFPKDPVIFPRGSLLVIDEGSMPPSELSEYVLQTVATVNPSLRILVVGDFVQLPPVGEDSSPMLELAYDLPSARFAQLKEVVRYDSELLTVATRLREEYERLVDDSSARPRQASKFFVEDLPDESSERKIYTDQNSFEKAIVKFTKKRGLAGFERNRVVAWRNVTVDRYAHLIRTTLGFTNAFEKGELVTLKSPLVELRYDTEKQRMMKKIVAAIDSACTVVDVQYEAFTLSIPSLGMQQKINTYNVLLKGEVNKRVRTVDPAEDTLDKFLSEAGRMLNRVKQQGGRPKWDEFYEVKESFLRLRYAYAGTAHRMQGSTLARAFIDVQDIALNRKPVEMIQCLYVSATRCTKTIHVLC